MARTAGNSLQILAGDTRLSLNHLIFGGLFSLLSLRLILWLPSLFEGTVLLVPFESSVGINNTIFNSEANSMKSSLCPSVLGYWLFGLPRLALRKVAPMVRISA